MKPSRIRRFWRASRITFRWCRIALLLLVLVLVCTVVYLNLVGLPQPLQRAVSDRVRAHGVDLAFANVRLDLLGGIVVDRVFVQEQGNAGAAQVSAGSVQVFFDTRALLRRRLVLNSILLHEGRVTLPLSTNAPGSSLVVDAIEARLRQAAPGEWLVDQLEGRCIGARLRLTGSLANAAQLPKLLARDAAVPPPVPPVPPVEPPPARPGLWREQVRQAVAAIEQVQFDPAPELICRISLDAADPSGLRASLVLKSGSVATPWGGARGPTFSAWIEAPPLPGGPPSARLLLTADTVETEWASARGLEISSQAWPLDERGAWRGGDIRISADALQSPRWGAAAETVVRLEVSPQASAEELPAARIDAEIQRVRTPWGEAQSIRATARSLLGVTNRSDLSLAAKLDVARLKTERASAGKAAVEISAERRDDAPSAETAAAWGPFAALAPYRARWSAVVEEVTAAEAQAGRIALRGTWLGPRLTVESLDASLAGGGGTVSAVLDAAARDVRGQLRGSLDPKQLGSLLGPKTSRWLEQFGWESPPFAAAKVGVSFPEWGAGRAAWDRALDETIWLDGVLTNRAGSFRTVAFDHARLGFNYTNQIWTLTNLVVRRPEGTMDIFHVSNEITKDHYWRIVGDGDLKAFSPVIGSEAADRALALFEFTGPSHIEGELWGRWRAMDRYGGRVQIEATNFTLRGESIALLRGHVQYTNGLVRFDNVTVGRTEGVATIAGGSLDVPSRILSVTNVQSAVDPRALFRLIGPGTVRTMEPYRFTDTNAPPRIRVDGRVNIEDVGEVDLKFDIAGKGFEWAAFQLPEVSARLHWTNGTLRIADVDGAFYSGRITGGAWFDFSDAHGTNNSLFGFDTTLRDVDLKAMLSGTTGKPSRTEGVLSGRLVVTNGATADLKSWNGWGHAQLRDGLLWDAPIFGFLSKPLDSIMPGLGNNRASAATNTFDLRSSVFHTDDLTIFTGPARLLYRGTVDFDTRVNARVEADLLRDSPVIGGVVSTVLTPLSKIFEFKVDGTLAEPKPEPVWFLPRLMFLPLAPFRTLEDWFGRGTQGTAPDATPER